MSLGADFEVSKSQSLNLMLVDQDVSSQLLLHSHASLPAAMLPAMTVMDSSEPSETVSPK